MAKVLNMVCSRNCLCFICIVQKPSFKKGHYGSKWRQNSVYGGNFILLDIIAFYKNSQARYLLPCLSFCNGELFAGQILIPDWQNFL